MKKQLPSRLKMVYRSVSILVVMEVGEEDKFKLMPSIASVRFNPCCNGSG